MRDNHFNFADTGDTIAQSWGRSTSKSKHDHIKELDDDKMAICLLASISQKLSQIIRQNESIVTSHREMKSIAQNERRERLARQVIEAANECATKLTKLTKPNQMRGSMFGGKCVDPHGLLSNAGASNAG